MEYIYDLFDSSAEITAYCSHCKLDTFHTVIDRFEDEIRSVLCVVCNSTHAYRAPRGEQEEEVPEPMSIRKRQALKKMSWDEVFKNNDGRGAREYSPRERYREGELVYHFTFGLGYVCELLSHTKLEVVFQEGRKLLAYNRTDISLPPHPPRIILSPLKKGSASLPGTAPKANSKAAAGSKPNAKSTSTSNSTSASVSKMKLEPVQHKAKTLGSKPPKMRAALKTKPKAAPKKPARSSIEVKREAKREKTEKKTSSKSLQAQTGISKTKKPLNAKRPKTPPSQPTSKRTTKQARPQAKQTPAPKPTPKKSTPQKTRAAVPQKVKTATKKKPTQAKKKPAAQKAKTKITVKKPQKSPSKKTQKPSPRKSNQSPKSDLKNAPKPRSSRSTTKSKKKS